MRTWTRGQYERFKRQERRDWFASQQAEADALAQQQEVHDMTHKRTEYGLAKRPPSIKEADKALDQLHELIGEALDAAGRAAEREQALSSSSGVDVRRFPAGG